MTMNIGIRRILVAAASAATLATTLAVAPAATAAPSPTVGLYGAAEPTYDGVFRQSLAIMGLAANDVAPPAPAIAWLLGQQCADGSFQAYRADLSQPCPKADPIAFTGPDTNSTATALMALMALDDSGVRIPNATLSKVVDAADKAGTWLRKQQNPDGGWPYYSGGASDANSTGLSLSGILTQAPSTNVPAYRKAARYLGSVSATCAAGGGFAYQAGSKVDGSASAQGLVGLVGPLPISGPRKVAAGAPCLNTAKAKAVSYLAAALAPTGVLPSSLGSGADYSNTATAVLGLVSAGQGRAAVTKATAALKANARSFVTGDGTSPGAAGLLLMVAEATGAKPTSFGGLDLVRTLNSSIRK
jgi:Prenyltransferase and squalene oxidase repeat